MKVEERISNYKQRNKKKTIEQLNARLAEMRLRYSAEQIAIEELMKEKSPQNPAL